jgi:hypothetical protein
MACSEGILVDDNGDDGGRQLLYQCVQFRQESLSSWPVHQEGKGITRLSDLVLMQDGFIMSPVAHFELLKITAHALDVVCFLDDDEGKHEDRIECVDAGEAVITALIHEDEIIPKGHVSRSACQSCQKNTRRITHASRGAAGLME